MKSESLLSLFTKLKDCPAHDPSISREVFLEAWDQLVREDVSPFTTPTVPIMAALVLNDDVFASLLLETERSQLLALVNLAIDRFGQKTHPPNKLGKIIAGSIIKKET